MNYQPAEYGVSIRTSRIFNEKSGRTVIVALDHGIAMGAIQGLERLGDRMEQLIGGHPEGVLINPGAIRRFGHLLVGRDKPAAIVAMDFPLFANYPGGEQIDGQVPTISAEEAVRLGADMTKICMIFGQERVDLMRQNFSFVANSIEACHRVGLPVMVEATTWGLGFTGKKIKDAKLLSDLARIAFETGADVVKSDFPEDPGDMEKIANACPAPVVILGGGKTKSIEGVLTDVLGCVQSGAAGVAFGRNVWQYPDPAKFVRAIQLVVHEQDLRGALDSLEEETENITRVI